MNSTYPPRPLNADVINIAPSSQFKKEVVAVVYSILLFFVVYIALVIASVFLAIGCCYLGITIVVAAPKLITVVLGLGLVGVGVSLVFFLIKFIFAKRTTDNSQRIELKEADQPRLFAFIRQLTEETQTPFPQKIFLSSQVNACVFYNSSFWSMFFPVRKNLEIGLGLVNAINMGEFKAVMAHEFGHFSQRSMKLGSFTYNVNQVIYNMLFENNSYTNFLQAWGNLDGILAIFASITIGIARGIQWILKQMYELINKRYMSLSREMEFHADAVAASVAGGNNLITAFHRINAAAFSYGQVIRRINESIPGKKATRNLFADQFLVLQQSALRNGLPLEGELPVITQAFLSTQHKSRINYKDQWASHPTDEERTDRLNQLGLTTPATLSRAWELFDHPVEWQEKLTRHVYEVAEVNTSDFQLYDVAEFGEQYEKSLSDWEMPEPYKDFFTGRFPDLQLLPAGHSPATIQWAVIDTAANRQLNEQISYQEADIQLMEAIAAGNSGIKSFDFDGRKYSEKDATGLLAQLRTETEALRHERERLDRNILLWLMQENPAGLTDYQHWNDLTKQLETAGAKVTEMLQSISQSTGMTLEQAQAMIHTLVSNHVPELKQQWQHLIDKGLITEQMPLHATIHEFREKQYAYLVNDQFINDEFNHLLKVMHDVDAWVGHQKFLAFRAWLLPTVHSKSEVSVG